MKLLKRIGVLFLTLTLLLNLTGCEFSFNGEQGEVGINLTALSVPTGITFDDIDMVSWLSVSNCDGYTVRVNQREYNVESLSFNVASVLGESQTFTFCIKARGKSLYTSDSAWSEVFSWSYEKQAAKFVGETFLHTGIGSSVDIVSAKSYIDYKNGVSVLDESKLDNIRIYKDKVNNSYTKYYSSQNIVDFALKSTVTTEVNVSNKSKAKGIFCNIDAGLKTSASFNYSSYTDKYYYCLDIESEKYILSLFNYAVKDTYLNCFSEEYLNDLEKLYGSQNKENFEEFFMKYGTHIIGSGIYGGRLNAYYSVATNKATIDNTISKQLETCVSAGISAVNNTSVSANVKSDIQNILNTTDIETNFYSVAYGGNAFSAVTLEELNNKCENWANSIDATEDKSVLINYSKDGLIALWDILPTEYETMKEQMIDSFINYYEENYNGFINCFDEDISLFESGSGTTSDPYIITNETQLSNINKRLSSHFKLANDITITNKRWQPIGTYYCEGSQGEKLSDLIETTAFEGVFDGNNKTISYDLDLDLQVTSNENEYGIGLFGLCRDAEIKNLNINAKIYCTETTKGARNVAGLLAGWAINCKISNCTTNGSVNQNRLATKSSGVRSGGMIGVAKECIFDYCINNANVSTSAYYAYAGGITGQNLNSRYNGCQNSGVITASKGSWWFGNAYKGDIYPS